MELPKKKSSAQIKEFWASKADQLNLTPEEKNSYDTDAHRMLTNAQQSYGPQFWNNNNQVEDTISQILNPAGTWFFFNSLFLDFQNLNFSKKKIKGFHYFLKLSVSILFLSFTKIA